MLPALQLSAQQPFWYLPSARGSLRPPRTRKTGTPLRQLAFAKSSDCCHDPARRRRAHEGALQPSARALASLSRSPHSCAQSGLLSQKGARCSHFCQRGERPFSAAEADPWRPGWASAEVGTPGACRTPEPTWEWERRSGRRSPACCKCPAAHSVPCPSAAQPCGQAWARTRRGCRGSRVTLGGGPRMSPCI